METIRRIFLIVTLMLIIFEYESIPKYSMFILLSFPMTDFAKNTFRKHMLSFVLLMAISICSIYAIKIKFMALPLLTLVLTYLIVPWDIDWNKKSKNDEDEGKTN